MGRLTTDFPQGNFETMLNYVFSRNGQAYIRSDNESPILLTAWAKEQCIRSGCDEFPGETPEEIDETICGCMFDEPDCPVFLAYIYACEAVHMRDRCKTYEDAIPFERIAEAEKLLRMKDEEKIKVLPMAKQEK